jgi:hypothetical protein
VDPILGNPVPVFEYDAGTWGPSEADQLTPYKNGWHALEPDRP